MILSTTKKWTKKFAETEVAEEDRPQMEDEMREIQNILFESIHEGAGIDIFIKPNDLLDLDEINTQIMDKISDTNEVVHQNAKSLAVFFKKAILPLSLNEAKARKAEASKENLHVEELDYDETFDGPSTPSKRQKLAPGAQKEQQPPTALLSKIKDLENRIQFLNERVMTKDMHQS